MSRQPWRWVDEQRRRFSGPLLTSPARRAAGAVVIVCAAVTAVLGVLVMHRSQAGWLDAAVDARIRAGLGGHVSLLARIAQLGGPAAVTLMTVALVLACLITGRWRGAALVAVAVPVAESVTEFLLKPLVGRSLGGDPSFPSGHTTAAFVVAAAVVVLLSGPQRPRIPAWARLLCAVVALLTAGAVAIAMVGLGYHYFTDTVGGAAVAVGMVLATALMLDALWLWRPRPPVSRQGQPARQPRARQSAALRNGE